MIYAIMIIFSVISGCLVPYAEKKKKIFMGDTGSLFIEPIIPILIFRSLIVLPGEIGDIMK